MKALRVVAAPGAEAAAQCIADRLGVERCALESRRFPDAEAYLRLAGDVAGCDVVVVAQLREPDPQLPGLLFLADALHELGAHRVLLAAPYLPYMRQDTRFRAGEAVTSRSVAKWLSTAFDALATVDPHLHRHATLDAVYTIPAQAVASAPAIATWLRTAVESAYLVGPDAESRQWVAAVAGLAGCPYTVLAKQRLGDREVALSAPDAQALRGHTPVLIDDIVASGRTMAAAVRACREAGAAAPVCVGVHAVFAGDAAALLEGAGAARVVTCNTLVHPSNAIDVLGALADAAAGLLAPVAAASG